MSNDTYTVRTILHSPYGIPLFVQCFALSSLGNIL